MSVSEHSTPSEPPILSTDLRNRVPGQSLFAVLAAMQASGEFGIDAESRRIHAGPTAEPWYIGLLGERRIGSLLANLGPGTTVLHSVPVGSKSSDVDHVVISQAGVFTINSKNHPGKAVWVGGRGMMVGKSKVSHLRNAIHEAKRAERLLSAATGLTVPVTAVVALVGVNQLTVRHPPVGDGVDIAVVLERNLLPLLTGRPVFSPEQVQRIADAAVRPRTWSLIPPSEPGVAELVAAFAALEAEPVVAPAPSGMRRAGLRRRPAAIVLLTVVGIPAFALLIGFVSLIASLLAT